MLDRLATQAHGLGRGIKALLDSFEHEIAAVALISISS